MASRKFRFVSPGVFLREIDNSQLPRTPGGVGPVIIGRTRKGPAMKPYKIRSMQEFERVFGLPMPGNQGEDIWREGSGLLAESYLPYAAHAYLSAQIDSPITVVRLAGVAHPTADATGDGEPGWSASSAFGLFVMPVNTTGSAASNVALPSSSVAELAAIFYGVSGSDFGIKLKGPETGNSNLGGGSTVTHLTRSISPSSGKFTIQLSSSAMIKDVTFDPSNMRSAFNTNPVLTNSRISTIRSGSLSHHYWLGETFEETLKKVQSISGSARTSAFIMELNPAMADFKSVDHGLTAARTGWVFGNDTSGLIDPEKPFQPSDQQKLFRLIALHEGEQSSRDLVISIEKIKNARTGALSVFGTFSVVVKEIFGTEIVEIERFDELNLDPNSENYIAKRIGDSYVEWDPKEKRNKRYGTNLNVSEFIRVDMDQDVDSGKLEDETTIPFGFYGPVRPKTFNVSFPTDFESDSSALGFASASVPSSWVTAQNLNLSGAISGSGVVSFVYPSLPLINTGSTSDLDVGGYIFGAAVERQEFVSASGTITTTINPGYIDFVRRSSDYETLAESQIKGTAGTHAEISYFFTLDDVILTASNGASVSTIASGGDVLRAVYKSGSRSPGTPSSTTLTFTGNPDSDQTITITVLKADGTTQEAVFTAKTSGNTDNNFQLGSPTAVTIGNLKSAIERNANIKDFIRVSPVRDSKITLTQVVPGVNGDLPIAENLANVSAPNFSGGGFDGNDASFTHHVAAGRANLRTFLDIVDGFHLPLVGGTDGVNIVEADPFNMGVVTSEATSQNSYAYASIERSIDMIRDAELVEHNLAAMPGITNDKLTTKLIRTCEARADSLAIIDLKDVYIPPFQKSCASFKDRVDNTTPERSANDLVGRQLNSSYGATYYPWVKIKDEHFGSDVWVPPSVVALGVMAYTEERDEVWFAPAGFNRGGLDTGNAGLPVLQASEQLLSKERDTLYAANINPIAQFVSEGLVIFGQKTLQSTQSALDRINVRRLLIFVKKEVSRISNRLLFEQNVQATWSRFTNQVVPFLDSVKTRFGLSDFKVILDETTTTPDLIDRNILYAKVLLKPARSIEFIAVDFVITNTGASFED